VNTRIYIERRHIVNGDSSLYKWAACINKSDSARRGEEWKGCSILEWRIAEARNQSWELNNITFSSSLGQREINTRMETLPFQPWRLIVPFAARYTFLFDCSLWRRLLTWVYIYINRHNMWHLRWKTRVFIEWNEVEPWHTLLCKWCRMYRF
jgi:hypothetical protein